MNNEFEMSELLPKWRDAKNLHCLEGSRGVKGLEELCKTIGYRDGNYFSDVIRNFLFDNSGAVEALFTWIEENHSQEAMEAIEEELGAAGLLYDEDDQANEDPLDDGLGNG